MPNPDARIISLAAELARPEADERHVTAQRGKTALHRLCVLHATPSATLYETESKRVMERKQLMDDLHHSSKLVALAAIDVLAIENEQMLLVCRAASIPRDEHAMSEMSELIEACTIALPKIHRSRQSSTDRVPRTAAEHHFQWAERRVLLGV